MHNIEIADARKFFWQWDTGCKLRLKGVTEGAQAHFYRDGMTEPLPVVSYALGEDIVCDIPDELLQVAETFAVYTYVAAEAGGKTYVSRAFPVKGRPKPVDYIYTPTALVTLEKAVEDALTKILDSGLEIGARGIVEVDALPTEKIDTTVFYSTAEGVYWYDGEWHKVADESELESAISDEVVRATEADEANATAIAEEVSRATEAERVLRDDIAKASKQIEDNILPHIVNADFEESNPESKAYILNRPFYDAPDPSKTIDIPMNAGGWSAMLDPDTQKMMFASDTIFSKGELANPDEPFFVDLRRASDGETFTLNLSEAIFTEYDGYIGVSFNGYSNTQLWVVTNYTVSDPWGHSYWENPQPPKNGLYVTGTVDSNNIEVVRLYREGRDIKKLENKYLDLKSNEDFKTVESIAKGATRAVSFGDYYSMVSAFRSLPADTYKVGQNVMIVTLEVPDLWISKVVNTPNPYEYLTDADFINSLKTSGYVQVGYYQLSMLETQKVDLTNYVKNTDYATASKAGLIKANNAQSGTIVGSDGTLGFYGILDNEWKDRNRNGYYVGNRVVTTKNTDMLVKTGITANTKTLEPDEKAAAQKWLGIPTTYGELNDKPFGGAEPINITYSKSGESVGSYDGAAYLQTEHPYSVNELIGATVAYVDENSRGSITLDTTHIMTQHTTDDGVAFEIFPKVYILVAYTDNAYQPDTFALYNPLPKAGVYFFDYADGDPHYVESLTKAGDFKQLDNKYIDLASHPDFASKQDRLSFDGEYNANTNKVATVDTVAREIAKITDEMPDAFVEAEAFVKWLEENGAAAEAMTSAITKNAEDIAELATSKVNVSDIVNNYNSTASNKPLSAYAGSLLNTKINAETNRATTAEEALGARIDSLSAKHDTDKASTETAISGINSNVSKISSDVSALSSKHNALEAKHDSAMSGVNTAIEGLAGRATSLEAEVEELAERASSHDTDITNIKKDISDIKANGGGGGASAEEVAKISTDLSILTKQHSLDMSNINDALGDTTTAFAELRSHISILIKGGIS